MPDDVMLSLKRKKTKFVLVEKMSKNYKANMGNTCYN